LGIFVQYPKLWIRRELNPLDLVIKGREPLSTCHVETYPDTVPIEQQYDYLQSIQGQLNLPSSWQTIQNILSTNSRIDLHHYFILFSQWVHGGIEPLLAKAPPEGLSRPSGSCSIQLITVQLRTILTNV
jgi:hypothetical protein